MSQKQGNGSGQVGNRVYDLEGIKDAIDHTPRDQELLVSTLAREGGPYTAFIRVPKAEVDAKCRAGFRRITHGEDEMMLGEAEDYTADWKHSE